ncbi:MAG: biotin--[Clostridia bacterium]|nr:biotin--[acetyl-CoA-carboxylase] ligase [Clostridia bacterium]
MNLYDGKNLTPPAGYTLQIVDEVSSTNTVLLQGEYPDKTVLLARKQTCGKGSKGRSFFSPEGGIYLSVLLKDLPQSRLICLTPLAAVAVYRALLPHTSKSLAIKWVNDIYLQEKKVCGILTESRFEGERPNTVVGVGINLLPQQFPDGFLHPPTSLLESPDPQKAENIINTFLREFENLLHTDNFFLEYKRICCTIGRRVCLRRGEEIIRGTAEDITRDFHLVIRLSDGTCRTLSSGEVTEQIQE